MKKLVLTAAILMGFAMSTYAQGIFEDKKANGGLFHRGDFSENYTKGDDAGFWLPGHNINSNWDAEEEGEDEAPIGSGALLLIGFGAAYAMSKRNKKD
ncbi:MAG: hypothetical protein K6G25_04680 [Bacteroidales bacterium]|nr:hypothetical protein [Bacteroidales bacterium]